MKKYNVHTTRNITLEQWCKDNNVLDILERWDYELNDKKPSEIVNLWQGKYWFKCQDGKHESQLHHIGNIIKIGYVPKCFKCRSFGCWCEENNRKDLLNRWDYELNNKSPYEVFFTTTDKYYMKCPKGIHPSELKNIWNMINQYGSSRCDGCYSIGQYGIDNIDKDFIQKYWSQNNTEEPMLINRNSKKKVLMKCVENPEHGEYPVSCANFYKGERCPYCSKKKMFIKDSLGYQFPQIFDIWVENKRTPYDVYPQSNIFVYLKCEKHGQYRTKLTSAYQRGFKCPKCMRELHESKLQRKVNEYICSLYDTVNHEFECNIIATNFKTNYKLPYDNEIPEIKLIIEVNGEQHYKASSYFYGENQEEANEKFKQRQELDKLKMEYALNQGYEFLVIPYWADDKKETWKTLIDDKINSITHP